MLHEAIVDSPRYVAAVVPPIGNKDGMHLLLNRFLGSSRVLSAIRVGLALRCGTIRLALPTPRVSKVSTPEINRARQYQSINYNRNDIIYAHELLCLPLLYHK